jgi:hypothetical protein
MLRGDTEKFVLFQLRKIAKLQAFEKFALFGTFWHLSKHFDFNQ